MAELLSNAPLSREQVIAVIEGRGQGVPRVPMLIHFWLLTPDEYGERLPAVRAIMARYPMDVQMVPLRIPDRYLAPAEDPGYRWFPWDDPYQDKNVAFDERVALRGWEEFETVLRHFPDPHSAVLFDYAAPADGRYRLGYWWYWLFERHWSWRGMTAALMDYYDHPAEVHRLFRTVTDFYKVLIERGRREAGLDGIMISDDLGTQKSPFFSVRIFEQFFRPYYQELVDHAHSLGLHFWMHACGNMAPLLPALVDIGVDVLHPIQKHAMDYGQIVARHGGRISFWAGVDLQQVIPWGTPEQVRQEVRDLVDAFWRPDGRLLLAASNAIHADCTNESLEAMLDEAFVYGAAVQARGAVRG